MTGRKVNRMFFLGRNFCVCGLLCTLGKTKRPRNPPKTLNTKIPKA